MKATTSQPPIVWTQEDHARHRAIREKFQHEKPRLKELVQNGEHNSPVQLGHYYDLSRIMAKLKKAREAAGKSLADIAQESGIGKAALSRLENGQRINPTLNTLYRYAAAIGFSIVLDTKSQDEQQANQRSRRGSKIKAESPK